MNESAPSPDIVPVKRGMAHYALGLLTVTYVFNFLDRQLLAILVEPIKNEFGVSDTAMGLLYGFGLGPVLVGVVSDMLTPAFGTEAIRHGLLIAMVTYVAAGACYFAASRNFNEQTYEHRTEIEALGATGAT
ncbi:MAG: MFS transporter [Gammaproteobacteria bacterium]|nr:MFS transporter [Gammaproteobacteria bacterium]